MTKKKTTEKLTVVGLSADQATADGTRAAYGLGI